MDVASTIWTIANSILTLIADHDDKTTTTKEIQSLVKLIQQDMTPLLSHPNELEANELVKTHLHVIQGKLFDIHYHLRLWSESKIYRAIAWFRPWVVIQQLKADRQLLMTYYLTLMGGVQFVDRAQLLGYNVISHIPRPSLSTPLAPPPTEPPFLITPANPPRPNQEVTGFWHRCVGNESTPANAENFCDDLSAYLALELSPVARKRLLLRLDERNTRHISLSTFQEVIKGGKLSEVVRSYTKDPQLPLLVWIDDSVIGNAPKVLEATKRGVTVIQLASTSTAQAWITMNKDFLMKHDNPSDIRYMSDQTRTEPGADGAMFTNKNAGFQIMKFIRDQGFKAPILICTSKQSVEFTRYVEKYRMAGSIANHRVFRDYVAALGARRQDDRGWMKFNAK
jgi:hypothetical protein